MKSFLIFIFVILLWNSCVSFKSNTSLCDKEVKSSIKSISRYISIDKNSRVYTVQYSKLPEIDNARFIKLRDSLVYIFYFQLDYRDVQHYLFTKQVENISNVQCEITISDVRKYFGVESHIGIGRNNITYLFYYFNNFKIGDCYNKPDKRNYSTCRLISLTFDENQILKNVNTEFFGY